MIKQTLIAVIVIAELFLSCTNEISGGGIEEGNVAVLKGTVSDTATAIVTLMPAFAAPEIVSGFDSSQVCTLSTNKIFEFDSLESGSYRISISSKSGKQYISDTLMVTSGTERDLGTISLDVFGAVKIILKKAESSQRYLYLDGVNRFAIVKSGENSAVFDSLPDGVIPAIRISGSGTEVADSLNVIAFDTVTVFESFRMLYVVHTTFDSAANALWQVDSLRSLNAHVRVVDTDSLKPADTTGIDLIYCGGSARIAGVEGFLRSLPLPVIVANKSFLPALGLTPTVENLDYGSLSLTDAFVMQKTHSLFTYEKFATPIPDTIPLPTNTIDWGIPFPSASIVAVAPSDNTKALLFTYEKGDQLESFMAPARRGVIWASRNSESDQLTQMLQALVLWAAGLL